MAYHMVDADPSAEFRSDKAAAVAVETATNTVSLRRETTAEWHNGEAAVGTATVFVQVVSGTATEIDFKLEACEANGDNPVTVAVAPTMVGPGRLIMRADQSLLDKLPVTLSHLRVVATPTGGNVKFGAWLVGGDQPVAKANATMVVAGI